MELTLVSKEKKSMVIELTDMKETLVHPLIDKLLSDKDVIFASYKTGHPQLDKPRLSVKTSKVKPETAIKRVAENLSKEFDALKKEFEKSMKKPKPKKEAKPKKERKTKKPGKKPAKKEGKKPGKKPAKKATKKPIKNPSKKPAKKAGKKTGKGKTKKKSK